MFSLPLPAGEPVRVSCLPRLGLARRHQTHIPLFAHASPTWASGSSKNPIATSVQAKIPSPHTRIVQRPAAGLESIFTVLAADLERAGRALKFQKVFLLYLSPRPLVARRCAAITSYSPASAPPLKCIEAARAATQIICMRIVAPIAR